MFVVSAAYFANVNNNGNSNYNNASNVNGVRPDSLGTRFMRKFFSVCLREGRDVLAGNPLNANRHATSYD